MRKGCFLFFICLFSNGIIGQTTTLVFQPDSACGKDAPLSSLFPDNNYVNHPDFFACKWTNGGAPVAVRSLIQFDFSGIPSGSSLVSATLELFHYSSPFNVGHSNLSGPDDASLYRITESWDESTVSWNTQPMTTLVNSVFIPACTTLTQNYSLNVTAIVQDMINDPANSFGFLFRENLEVHYRSMLFASSDNADLTLHPKLTLVLADSIITSTPCAADIVTTPEPVSEFSIPNVFSPNGDGQNDVYFIDSEGMRYTMQFFNRWGTKVAELNNEQPFWNGKNRDEINCSDGTYFYILKMNDAHGHEHTRNGYVMLISGIH